MKNKTIRLQFEVSLILAKEIEALEAEADVRSHREFFANLISLWRWSAGKIREGKTIAAINLEGDRITQYHHLSMPAFDSIQKSK